MKTIIKVPIEDKPGAALRHRALTARKLMSQVSIRIFLIVMSVLFLVPLYWMIITALKSAPELAVFPATLWPKDVQWDNFVKAYDFIPFARYFLNTVVITAVSVIGAVLSSLFVAYGFACIKWPGRDLVFYLVIATIFIPFPIAVVPLFDLFAWLHWVNTFLPLTVPAFLANAFFVFLLRQFLLQIPSELLDAARIDGASELQILARVIFPLACPALAVVAIFTAIGSWNDFLGPLIYLTDDSVRTLAVGLTFFSSAYDVQFNLLMAAALMAVIPVIILFFVFQRFFIRGVTLGSIR